MLNTVGVRNAAAAVVIMTSDIMLTPPIRRSGKLKNHKKLLDAEGGMPTRLYGSLAVSYAYTLHSRRYPARLVAERDSQGLVGAIL